VVELERQLHSRVHELERALVEVKQLKQFLPICMYCKSVRDDKRDWRQIEEFVHGETGSDFTHCICPTCMEKWKQSNDPL
jgi:sigma-B regulation protein RsbU (phosphoserine phosphatase)